MTTDSGRGDQAAPDIRSSGHSNRGDSTFRWVVTVAACAILLLVTLIAIQHGELLNALYQPLRLRLPV